MRGHAGHLLMCSAMVVVALAIVALTGSGFVLVPVIGCVVMMGAMMLMMGSMGGRGGDDRRR